MLKSHINNLPISRAPQVDRSLISCFGVPYDQDRYDAACDSYQSLGILTAPEIFKNATRTSKRNGMDQPAEVKRSGSDIIVVQEPLGEFISLCLAFEAQNSDGYTFRRKSAKLIVRRENGEHPAQTPHTDPARKTFRRLFHIYMAASRQTTNFTNRAAPAPFEVIAATSASSHFRPALQGEDDRVWATLIVSA